MRGPLGAGTDWATEARSAAHCGAARGAVLEGDGAKRVASWTPLLLQSRGRDDHIPVPSWPCTLTKHEPKLIPLPGAPNVGGILQPGGGKHPPNPS
jgi:hypothetical protein